MQFTRADIAEWALFESPFNINWMRIEATAAYPWHQREFDSLPPGQVISQWHILNVLNDDLLAKVFNRMSLLDLTNAANVYVHFYRLAKIVFDSKFKRTVNIDFFYSECSRRRDIKAIFRNFGSSIQSIHVIQSKAPESYDRTLKYVSKHTPPALKELHIYDFNFFERQKLNSSIVYQNRNT